MNQPKRTVFKLLFNLGFHKEWINEPPGRKWKAGECQGGSSFCHKGFLSALPQQKQLNQIPALSEAAQVLLRCARASKQETVTWEVTA